MSLLGKKIASVVTKKLNPAPAPRPVKGPAVIGKIAFRPNSSPKPSPSPGLSDVRRPKGRVATFTKY